jgi:hypothetical protein
VAVGCTVTSDNKANADGGEGGSATGAGGGTAGANTAGANSAGTNSGGNSSGGASNGGASGAAAGGAAGGTSITCDAIALDAGGNACDNCVKAHCCQELKDCGSNPVCIERELPCIQTCLENGIQGKDGGSTSLADCASTCQSPDGGGSTAPETDALLGCIDAAKEAGPGEVCSTECFGAPVAGH